MALAYIRNLDYGSAFVAELRGGPQYRGWTEDRYLSAALVNALRTLIYVFVLANTDPKKKSRRKPPSMWPLPDEIKKKHKPGSFGFIAGMKLAALKRRKALTSASR